MTERELGQLGLLDEISIRELEQRLEFEAWCPPTNVWCEPVEDGGCPVIDIPPSG